VPPAGPKDPSRRRLLGAGAAGAAALAGLRPGKGEAATPIGRARIAWSTDRACPGELAHAIVTVPGAPDGQPIRVRIRLPGGTVARRTASLAGGRARVPFRLELPASHRRPGTHVFSLTVEHPRMDAAPALLEVIAGRFAFGL